MSCIVRRHFLRGLQACIIAMIMSFSSVSAAFAQSTTPSFEDNHKELKDDKTLQFELAEPIPPPERKKKKKKKRGASSWGDFSGGFNAVMTYVFYGILAVLVATILFFIVREFVYFRLPEKAAEDEEEEAPPPLYAPDAENAQVLLDDVDQLAKDGNYAEAVHTLLFRSIQDIETNRPHSIKQSLTSREIGRLEVLAPDARTAFSKIGSIVEQSFFGKQKIGREDFEICREAYAQFTRPKVWS